MGNGWFHRCSAFANTYIVFGARRISLSARSVFEEVIPWSIYSSLIFFYYSIALRIVQCYTQKKAYIQFNSHKSKVLLIPYTIDVIPKTAIYILPRDFWWNCTWLGLSKMPNFTLTHTHFFCFPFTIPPNHLHKHSHTHSLTTFFSPVSFEIISFNKQLSPNTHTVTSTNGKNYFHVFFRQIILCLRSK